MISAKHIVHGSRASPMVSSSAHFYYQTIALRQVAGRIGIEPSYLSKIERGEHQAYLTEEKIYSLARELNEDPDVLLALSGKVSQDIQAIICKRPRIFAQLIRELKDMPDHVVLQIVRKVREGNW